MPVRKLPGNGRADLPLAGLGILRTLPGVN